jgi:hypothetical protein
MKFEPGSFYFGVVDFFSILLPGALLAYFLYGPLGPKVFGPVMPAIQDGATGAGWVIFLFAAYLLGHIVFLIGSYLDNLYDPVRRLIWPKKTDHAYRQAEILKKKLLGPEMAGAVNTFQWARAVLTLSYPQGMVEVARLEADSKFFRSLMVVLSILFISVIWQGVRDLVPAVLGMLLVLSYLRYTERRYKSTEQAYRYMIVLASQKKLAK